MLKVLTCIASEHDLRLVGLSAIICMLGCFTTTTLMRRADESGPGRSCRWLVSAAVIFGCSVWSLHFVAMLAFMPDLEMFYDVRMTAASIAVASLGATAALLVRRIPVARPVRVGSSGVLLGLTVAAMHHLGVAAMKFSGALVLDGTYVAVSVAVGVGFSVVAIVRADGLTSVARRAEVAGWLSLAVCGVHFIGMAAIGMVPGMTRMATGTMLGSATLGIAVGTASVVILVASLAAATVEQHMSQRALQELDRMRLMSNLAQEVLFIHRDSVVLEINSAGERLFKATARDIIGRPVLSLFTEDSAPALIRREQRPPAGRHPETFDLQAVDGTSVRVELSCHPIDYLGKPATVVVLQDLTDRKRNEERFQHLARHDGLTGLPNRHALLERLDHRLELAGQRKGAFAIVHLDLDRFKPVNDLHGHAAGDALLVEVSRRILSGLQPADTLARIGGDEFVMLLTSDLQPERVSIAVTHIIEMLRPPFRIEGHCIEIGASIGISLYPHDGATADALLRAADTAMYRVKEDGRGALRFYEASMNELVQTRLQLEQELAGAVEREELVLHYQPIVDGITGDVECFEALIRWNHPERGMIAPAEFIPLAEETGLIGRIGTWVIETACREATTWDHPWRISITSRRPSSSTPTSAV